MKRLRELLKTAIDLHLEGRPLRSRRLLADLKNSEYARFSRSVNLFILN